MSSRLSAKAGLAIRKLRLAGGWTLAQLSEKSGVPLSTLSKVELGQTSLSYENLLRICRGLEIDMARLLGAEADGEVGGAPAAPAAVGRRAVVRSGQGDPVTLPAGPARLVGGDLTRKAFTPVVVEVQATTLDAHGGFQRDDGEAWLMVLEGELALNSELYSPLHLKAGDGVYFDARAGYALLREGKSACRAVLVFAGDRQGLA
jgi:DNA-binding Xre family transcriptional regulator